MSGAEPTEGPPPPPASPGRQLVWLLLLLAVVGALFWFAMSEVWELWFRVQETPAP